MPGRGPASVREQHRQARALQHGAGDAAEHLFAPARVAEAAHHQQVGDGAAAVFEDGIAGAAPALFDDLDLRLAAVPGQVPRDVGAGRLAVAGFTLLENASARGQFRLVLVGLGLIFLMVFRPQGMFGNRKEMALDGR